MHKTRQEFLSLLNEWLEPEKFKDVGENGLQIEGTNRVQKIVCGVTANQALIDAAVAQKADAIFVHHGLVWGGGIRALKGWLAKRVRTLMANDINLFAYHLPLDAHPTLGNNAGLADAMGIAPESHGAFGMFKGQAIGLKGLLKTPTSFADVAARVEKNVGPAFYIFGDPKKEIRSVGLCTGGAPDRIHEAVDEGLDLYVTGEVTEYVKSISDETGIAFIGAGHHQTERFGAQRVSAKLEELGFDSQFVDVKNPA